MSVAVFVAWLSSGGIGRAVFGGGQGPGGFALSHAVSFKGDAVGVVYDSVQDGVGNSGFAYHVMPLCDGKLGGDERGFSPIAFFEDFEEIEALLVVKTVSAPIVEHKQMYASKLIDDAGEAAVEAGHGEILEQTRHAQIKDGA